MSPNRRARPIEVSHEGVSLSGLIAEPEGEPRALIVALHGHGMTARYFDGPADPDLSLLELGASLGFTVWAPDRVGYGAAAEADPALFAMFPQARFMCGAIDGLSRSLEAGSGCFLIGHSFGLKLALAMAASPPVTPLLGIDGSGSGLNYAFEPGVTRPAGEPGDINASWGPARLYPERTLERGVLPAAPMATPPPAEVVEWPDDFRGFGERVVVPVRFTFGDHERLWELSEAHFESLRAVLVESPRVEIELQVGAGHNVSLSKAGRAYHLKALAFAEECLLGDASLHEL